MARGGLEPGTVIDGRYEVQRPLGEGGMGAVFVVRHLVTKHLRALKVLHAEYASHPEIIERFLREASAAGRIGNEHVVETFDGGRLPDGEAYLVMELLEGRSLRDELAQHPEGLPLSAARRVMSELCDGVEAAHQAGIVHRDLKPENVFLARRKGAADLVKVLDFGISKFEREAQSLTQTGGALGTPLYMAPEQLERAKDVTSACDVYALGVIAFECLTGKHPYPADSMAALVRAIVLHVPPAPSTLRRGLSPAVDEVVLGALEKRPEARPASPRHFAEALARALDDALASQGGTLAAAPASAVGEAREAAAETEPPKVEAAAREREPRPSEASLALADTGLALELNDTVSASASELPRAARPEVTLQPASEPRRARGEPEQPASDRPAPPRRLGAVALALGLAVAVAVAVGLRAQGARRRDAASSSAVALASGLPSSPPDATGLGPGSAPATAASASASASAEATAPSVAPFSTSATASATARGPALSASVSVSAAPPSRPHLPSAAESAGIIRALPP